MTPTEKLYSLFAKLAVPTGVPQGAAKGGPASIYIYGDIAPGEMGGIDAKQVVDMLASAKGAKVLNVHINSVGGDVYEGLAIYNALMNFPGEVVCYVDGLAASIASTIAMAGDRIVMAPEAQIMIHSPWTFCAANAEKLRTLADRLDAAGASLASIYQKRTGQAADVVAGWMSQDTYFDATAAVAAGLATEIQGAPATRPAASAAPSRVMAALRLTDERLALASMEMAVLKNKVAASRA